MTWAGPPFFFQKKKKNRITPSGFTMAAGQAVANSVLIVISESVELHYRHALLFDEVRDDFGLCQRDKSPVFALSITRRDGYGSSLRKAKRKKRAAEAVSENTMDTKKSGNGGVSYYLTKGLS